MRRVVPVITMLTPTKVPINRNELAAHWLVLTVLWGTRKRNCKFCQLAAPALST